MVFLTAKQNQKRQGFQFNWIEYIHAGHKKKMIKSYFPDYFLTKNCVFEKQFTTHEENQLKNII